MTVAEPQTAVLAYSVCLSEERQFRKPRRSQVERSSRASSLAVVVSQDSLVRAQQTGRVAPSRPVRGVADNICDHARRQFALLMGHGISPCSRA